MASIRRTPGGKWQVRYRDPAGKTRGKTVASKAEARQLANEIEADMTRGRWRDPADGRRELVDWTDEWWATTSNLRPSSRARDESYMRKHVLKTFGARPIGSITQLEVRAWVAELSLTRRPATVHKAYQTLSKIMHAAVDGGLILTSPCHKVPLPRIEHEEMRFLNTKEVAKLAGAIDDRYRALVLLAAYGGLRISELAGLRRGRVNVLAGTVAVVEQAVEVKGKLHIGPPKTNAGRRTVPLPRQVAAELGAHIGEFVGDDPSAFVFTAADGSPLRPATWRRRFWATACTTTGFGVFTTWKDEHGKEHSHYEGLRPHDLRHTAVAFWIAAGASDLEVCRRAGHTSVAVVKDRYGHLFPEQITATTERLEAMYSGPSKPADVARLWPATPDDGSGSQAAGP